MFRSLKWGLMIMASLMLLSGSALARKGALIHKGKPERAASWKSLGPGKYQFTLKPGTAFEDVKSTLEKKLKAIGAKVTGSGTNVVLTYTGSEANMLKLVEKARIRKKSSQSLDDGDELASGGLRAKVGDRALVAGEIRGRVLKALGPGKALVLVVKKHATVKGVPPAPTKVSAPGQTFKPGEVIFFKAGKKSGGFLSITGVKRQ